MFDQNITSITEAILFLLLKTIWKWQKGQSYWKKRNKKFRAFLTLISKRWFLLAKTTWKWQKEKRYWKKRKKLGEFFRYDVIQERMWFRGLLTPIFKKDGFY